MQATPYLVPASCTARAIALEMQECKSPVKEGMVLESHIEDLDGRVLVASGTEVHEALIQKLAMLIRSGTGVKEPVQVRVLNLQSKKLVTA